MHTSRVVTWTTADPESARTVLLRRAARPRLLVPVPHGTFVLGPDPRTSATLLDNLRLLRIQGSASVGLMWTETTAWLVYYDGAVRGWRFGPDSSFEPESPRRLPEGLGWLTDAVEAVRGQGIGALRDALESAGFPAEAAALLRIDGGEVDDAVPHHEKKWWESVIGERHGMSEAPGRPFGGGNRVAYAVSIAVGLPLVMAFIAWITVQGVYPSLFGVTLLVLGGLALPVAVGWSFLTVHRVRRAAPFPERDVLGMSAWARAAEEE
ncbi:hypothetical protein LFM09_37495 [Lentzea alba]|uniref:hypothetical protein n=1 Tax=Lentzea alba TaxID=2714351 RepID=UPI0039BFF0C4